MIGCSLLSSLILLGPCTHLIGISLAFSSEMSRFCSKNSDSRVCILSGAGFLSHFRNVVENKIVLSAMAF